MLTTEAEAKTKRCQEGFPASQGITTDGSIMSTSVPMVSHAAYGAGYGGSYGVQTASAPMCCIGSACMAWRWRGWTNDGPDGPDHHLTQRNPTNDHPDYHRYGYCGKAGKP